MNQDSMDIIKANQNLEAYQKRIAELEKDNKVWVEASELWVNVGHQNADLQNRLSTLEKEKEQ